MIMRVMIVALNFWVISLIDQLNRFIIQYLIHQTLPSPPTRTNHQLDQSLILLIKDIYNMFATDKKPEESPSRQLFFSQKKGNKGPEDCQYCIKKQKLSNGDPNQRCLLHSIRSPKLSSTPKSSQSNLVDELMELLEDVEDLLEEYWQNLYKYSEGSPQKVKDELTPVFASVSRIQQKLSRFPFGESLESPSRAEVKRPSWEQDRKQTRSQKMISTNYAQLFEDTTVNDQIKEWVIYFSKILINKEIKEEILPFDDQLDLRIFKESMERKFLAFARDYNKYEARLSLALQKLLFYMQACGNTVSQKVLHADIKFMESSEIPKHSPSQTEYSLLMMQALTIEDLLARTEVQ